MSAAPRPTGGPEVESLPDAAAVADRAAGLFVEAAREAIAGRGVFDVCLSGGSTPRALYRRLVAGRPELDWSRVRFFFGDERCVPPEHADSNYGLAEHELFRHLAGIRLDSIFRMPGELAPKDAAAEYETILCEELGDDWPRFDLTLLGLGTDGHTASLFPGMAAVAEQERRCVASHVVQLNAWRLTLTPPAINASARILMLVSGAAKAPALQEVLHGPREPIRWPAQAIRPSRGTMRVLADLAALGVEPGAPQLNGSD